MQMSCYVAEFLRKVFLSKILKASLLKFLLLYSVQISFKIPSLFGKSCRPIFCLEVSVKLAKPGL